MEYFNLHTHQLQHPDGVTALVNQYPWEFHEGLPCYSMGIHPWYIDPEQWTKHLDFMETKVGIDFIESRLMGLEYGEAI